MRSSAFVEPARRHRQGLTDRVSISRSRLSR